MLQTLPAKLMNDLAPHLQNYLALIGKVDDLCLRITEAFGEQIACRAGCSGCCRHLSLFPVEACALALAVSQLPPETRRIVRAQAKRQDPLDPCPLLHEERCLAYEARPVICRTHGLPLLLTIDGTRQIDFCPENFQGVDSLPGQAIINLDLLNQSLAAINALFMSEVSHVLLSEQERFTVAEMLGALLAETD